MNSNILINFQLNYQLKEEGYYFLTKLVDQQKRKTGRGSKTGVSYNRLVIPIGVPPLPVDIT